jgi:hypothetical protein
MIKGIEHMYAIDQSKFVNLRHLAHYATCNMFSHPTAWCIS